MRNLKKVLALVLALMMALSLMVTASASDYTDDSSIEKDEAVDVMSALEVFNGINGAFQPEGTLSRAQAAKIIAYLQLGPVAAEEYLPELANSQMFDDVQPTKWYAGAVNYCANLGIVNGVGNNKFNPNGPVKGYEFAKMLLGALGYSAEIEGYNASDPKVGSMWTLNVSKQAKLIGMDENVTYGSKELTREEACQMAYNILAATMVKYDKDGNISDLKDKDGNEVTLGGSVFSLEEAAGTVVKIGETTTVKVDGTTDTEYVIASDPTLLGHNVTVFYKVDKDEKNIGYTIKDNSTTVELTDDADANKAALAAALGVDKAKVEWNKDANLYDTTKESQSGTQATLPEVAGTAIIDVVKGKKVVTGFVKATEYTLTKVTAIDKDGYVKLASAAGQLKESTTGSVYKDVAVDDIVVTYQIGSKYYVSPAETVVGKATAADENTVTVNGTKYTVEGKNATSAGLDADCVTAPGKVDFTTEYTLYLNPNGTVFAVVAPEKAKTDSNLVYVIKAMEIAGTGSYGQVENSLAILAMDMDGNIDTYKIAEITEPTKDEGLVTQADEDNKELTVDDLEKTMVGHIVALAEADEEGYYNIDMDATMAAYAEDGTGTIMMIDKQNNFTAEADSATIKEGAYYDDNVKFIYFDGKEATVVDGVQKIVVTKDEGNAAENPYIFYLYETVKDDKDNDVQLVNLVIILDSVPEPEPEYSTDVIFITGEEKASANRAPYTAADGTTKTGYIHTVYLNGEKQDIIVAEKEGSKKDAGFYSYAMDGEKAYILKPVEGAKHLTGVIEFESVFRNLVIVKGDDAKKVIPDNTSAAGATVINTKNDDNITVATLGGCKGYCVLDADGKTIVTVYVTDVPAAEDNEGDGDKTEQTITATTDATDNKVTIAAGSSATATVTVTVTDPTEGITYEVDEAAKEYVTAEFGSGNDANKLTLTAKKNTETDTPVTVTITIKADNYTNKTIELKVTVTGVSGG